MMTPEEREVMQEIADAGDWNVRDCLVEIDRLAAIVGKLPKTADGITVVPGDTVWFRDVYDRKWTSDEADILVVDSFYDDFVVMKMDACYSTREAALAAKEAAK